MDPPGENPLIRKCLGVSERRDFSANCLAIVKLSPYQGSGATHFLKSSRPWRKIKRKYTWPIQMTVQMFTGLRRLGNYLNSAKAFNVPENINIPSTMSVKVPLDTSGNAWMLGDSLLVQVA
jgi:hypothetical protein